MCLYDNTFLSFKRHNNEIFNCVWATFKGISGGFHYLCLTVEGTQIKKTYMTTNLYSARGYLFLRVAAGDSVR
jgi:hypothetical protein